MCVCLYQIATNAMETQVLHLLLILSSENDSIIEIPRNSLSIYSDYVTREQMMTSVS